MFWTEGTDAEITNDDVTTDQNSDNLRLYCPEATNHCDANSFPSELSAEITITEARSDGKEFKLDLDAVE